MFASTNWSDKCQKEQGLKERGDYIRSTRTEEKPDGILHTNDNINNSTSVEVS